MELQCLIWKIIQLYRYASNATPPTFISIISQVCICQLARWLFPFFLHHLLYCRICAFLSNIIHNTNYTNIGNYCLNIYHTIGQRMKMYILHDLYYILWLLSVAMDAILTCAVFFAVSLKTSITFAHKMCWQIATLRIRYATGCNGRVLAFVNIWNKQKIYKQCNKIPI